MQHGCARSPTARATSASPRRACASWRDESTHAERQLRLEATLRLDDGVTQSRRFTHHPFGGRSLHRVRQCFERQSLQGNLFCLVDRELVDVEAGQRAQGSTELGRAPERAGLNDRAPRTGALIGVTQAGSDLTENTQR